MASRLISDLVPEMQEKAEFVKQRCMESGFEINIYCTLRSLEEQAQLYMQSRTQDEIDVKITKLNNLGFTFIADILIHTPHKIVNLGRHVTNAGPGESFHNYKEAFDAAPTTADGNLDGVAKGKIIWDYNVARTEWDLYGEAVVAAGLNWAGNWTSFPEMPHAQLRSGGNPLKSYSPDQIYNIMKQNGLL